jgi:hypothetical protein
MKNAIIVSMLCSVLVVGCAVEEGTGGHAAWLNTPDGGACADVVCDEIVGNPCCQPAAPAPASKTVTIGAAHGNVTPGGGFTFVAHAWRVDGSGMMHFPLDVTEGCRIDSWQIRAHRNNAATGLEAVLEYAVDGIATQVGPMMSNFAGVWGPLTLTGAGINHNAIPQSDYSIMVRSTTTNGGDFVYWGRVTYACGG